MADSAQDAQSEDERSWQGDFDPFSDPDERRVLFATFDSFRCVTSRLIIPYIPWGTYR